MRGLTGKNGLLIVVTGLVAALVVSACGGPSASSGTPSSSASAGPDTSPVLAAIHQRKVLRVCSTGDYRPFTYFDPPTGKWSGIDIEMATDLARRISVPLTVVHTSWASLAKDLTGGACDLAMGGISVTPGRASVATFTPPYLRDGKTPITQCANVAKYQTLAQVDQPDVRVVVNPGGTNESYDKATLKKARIVEYPDNNTIFDELVNGHDNLMLTDASETQWQAHQHPGVLCAVHPDRPFTMESKAYLLPKGDQGFADYVDNWLRADLGNGTYQTISQRYLG